MQDSHESFHFIIFTTMAQRRPSIGESTSWMNSLAFVEASSAGEVAGPSALPVATISSSGWKAIVVTWITEFSWSKASTSSSSVLALVHWLPVDKNCQYRWNFNFRQLVLGCIKTDFCVQIRIFQHFSSSTRFTYLCTAPHSKFADFLQIFSKFRWIFEIFAKKC